MINLKYDFTAIEKKWQTKWKDEKTFACQTGEQDKPKFYGLVEFPYPSAQGLHVGHARPFTAMDRISMAVCLGLMALSFLLTAINGGRYFNPF